MENDLAEESRKETQEYIYHIGERVHKLQILAKDCYIAVRKFNVEMMDFSEEEPDLIADLIGIDKNLRLKITRTDKNDPDVIV